MGKSDALTGIRERRVAATNAMCVATLTLAFGIAGCGAESPPAPASDQAAVQSGSPPAAGPIAAAMSTAGSGAPSAKGMTASAASAPNSAETSASGMAMVGAPATPVTPQPAGASAQMPAAAAGAGMPAATDPAACDRACLSAMLDAYFAALAAKDPSGLPTSTSLKYTENGAVTKLGEGLWQTGGKLRADTRMDAIDVQAGQAGCQVVLDDGQSMPAIFQLRLKVVAHEIAEIETMVVRQNGAANGFFSLDGMKPQAVFKQAVDPEKRMTREQMKAQVDRYFDALDSGDWNRAMTQFDDNCSRYENGVATAMGATQIRSQSFMFNVVRRYLIFDEEAGLTWGMFPFSQSDNTLVVAELFKVMDEKIMMIQAVMAYMPSKGWD
jgi:hypothetical protein